MSINGDGNWVNILNDAVVAYNNNIHSTINMTPVDASNNLDILYLLLLRLNIRITLIRQLIIHQLMLPNNPDTVRYIRKPASQIISNSTKTEPKFKVGDYVRNADKRNILSIGYTSNWNRELFKVNEVLNRQPLTYKIEDMKGEIIEGKYYEQEFLKSEFDFESNNKDLESFNIFLNINNEKN